MSTSTRDAQETIDLVFGVRGLRFESAVVGGDAERVSGPDDLVGRRFRFVVWAGTGLRAVDYILEGTVGSLMVNASVVVFNPAQSMSGLIASASFERFTILPNGSVLCNRDDDDGTKRAVAGVLQLYPRR